MRRSTNRITRFVVMLLATLIIVLPGAAFAADRHDIASKRWRTEVRAQLKAHKVWSKKRENTVVNIIAHESTGNPRAKAGGHLGLLQFNKGWKANYSQKYWKKHKIKGKYYKDNRKSGYWSIHRIAHVYAAGGDRAVARHWKATYRK